MQHNILILDNELEMGGKEKLLYQFIERVDRSRFRIVVCCLKRGGFYQKPIQALGVPFYDGLLRHRYDALAFRSLARIMRAERIDMIETFAHPNTVLLSFLARQQGLAERVVVSHHAVGSAHRARVIPSYTLPVLRRMDAHLAVAEAQRRYLVDVEKLPAARVHLIYNGVDAAQYHPATPEERAAARSLLGIADAELVIMAVGSLKPLKGFDVLIRSAAAVLHARPAARLVFVGDGVDRALLQALAKEQGVADQVVFAGLRDDVDVVLRAADVLALSSRTEALPTVILEAMATALPVVATRVGGVPELVEPDRTALLVPPNDEAALRTALERVADAPDLRRSMGARGRALVEARFKLERMVEAREALFEKVLGGSTVSVVNGS
ncbi:MAG TPA: glycosyltransferase [Candidatus Krumholzibacteria bacterium]|nr:glycosyltransferase [Candidatus Krumholzibacteria bacterium]